MVVVVVVVVSSAVLEPQTQYVISVRAFNNVGKGHVIYDIVHTKQASGKDGSHLDCSFRCNQSPRSHFVAVLEKN